MQDKKLRDTSVCMKNCFACEKWLNAEFKERGKMSKEKIIERLESIKETFETFAYGLDDIHLDIEALEYAIDYMEEKENAEKKDIC